MKWLKDGSLQDAVGGYNNSWLDKVLLILTGVVLTSRCTTPPKHLNPTSLHSRPVLIVNFLQPQLTPLNPVCEFCHKTVVVCWHQQVQYGVTWFCCVNVVFSSCVFVDGGVQHSSMQHKPYLPLTWPLLLLCASSFSSSWGSPEASSTLRSAAATWAATWWASFSVASPWETCRKHSSRLKHLLTAHFLLAPGLWGHKDNREPSWTSESNTTLSTFTVNSKPSETKCVMKFVHFWVKDRSENEATSHQP